MNKDEQMKPIEMTVVEEDENPELRRYWTGDYALDHFELPHELAASLIARRSRLDEEIHARRLKQRDARLAKAGAEAAAKPATSPLVWQQKFDPAVASYPVLKILSRKDVDALYAAENEGTRSCEPGDAKRAEALCKALAAKGEYRRLAQVPTDWVRKLNSLEEDFPNFKEVIRYLRAMFSLALAAPIESPNFAVANFDPILIDGPPGVGKSFFCHAVAEMLGVPFRRHDLGSMQTSSELVGSDAMWANAKMGGVFKVLTEGDYANPVLLLDELDKSYQEQRYSADTSLLALLERSTSTRFYDLSIPDVPIDASRIHWIATSNDKLRISAPLRSRFRTFDVEPIPEEQKEAFVMKIFSSVVDEMRVDSEKVLPPPIIKIASTLSPRHLRRVLREALAYATLESRSALEQKDIEYAVGNERRGQKQRIGFTISE